jgi:hypothetical protein
LETNIIYAEKEGIEVGKVRKLMESRIKQVKLLSKKDTLSRFSFLKIQEEEMVEDLTSNIIQKITSKKN